MIWLFIENVYLISTLTSKYRKDKRLCATFSVQKNSLPGAIIETDPLSKWYTIHMLDTAFTKLVYEDIFKFCNLELFNPVAAIE